MTDISNSNFLNLNDIVDKATNNTISLPTVQRGFVWKPYQIENLWDSLLRGYPIGSFVLSKKKNSVKEEYELLDGQQRASAVCLGFYNPLDKSTNTNNKIFKTSNDNIMIFIDLVKPYSENDNRKYLFRVITKSHPWGYRRKENQKVLESNNIKEAMRSYEITNYDYLHKPLKEFWPYDSYKPIPLGLFINATSIENLKSSIQNWTKELKVNDVEKLKVIEKRNEPNIKYYSIEEIFEDVRKMLDKQKIPLLFLDLQKLYDVEENNITINQKANVADEQIKDTEGDNVTDDEKLEENEQGKIEDRNVSEIENLFIRLNSGGTPLRGEELNYSVLKAHITLKLQNKIEEKCKGLFYPARFITIAFRLFNNKPDQYGTSEKDSISMNIKPKQFQRMMREKNFIIFLESFLDSDNIKKTKEILIYSKTNQIGLPTFIAYSLADKAPEIMFMLLYRLYIKQDVIADDLKLKVLGIITLFTWLGKGEKQRDHGKLLENIWPCVKNFDTGMFWSNKTIQRAMLMDGESEILTPFPNLTELKKIIPEAKSIPALTWAKIRYSDDYGNFIDKMFFNKDVILYAQREAMFKWFYEIEEYNLEDTNRAFDWDHICPSSYIQNKRNIHPALKNWYNSNGNLRALPYSLNRGDQDDAPSVKLYPTTKADLDWWSKSLKHNYSTERQLRDHLLNLFCCDKNWLNLNNDIKDKIKEYKTAKDIIYCILNRNIKLCVEWYEQLKINELIAENPKDTDRKEFFESVINNKMWSGKKDEEDNDRYKYCLTIGEKNLYLYFSFNIESNTLKEDCIYFGIDGEVGNEILGKIKIPEKKEEKYQKEEGYGIYNWFTLVSFHDNSVIFLFKEFKLWLNEFPDKKIRDSAIIKFKNSIKSKYKNKI